MYSNCSVSQELLAVYIIIKLSAYCKQHSIHKIPMDCSKFYVVHQVTFLCTSRSECQQYNHRLNHCLCMAQWKQCYVLELLHYCVCWVVFILVDGLVPGSNLFVCLFVASGWLLLAITIITPYLIPSNGCTPRQKKQVLYHQAGLLAGTGNDFRHNMYVYNLYLRYEDAILSSLCTSLPITNTIAGEWLSSLKFHDDNKIITAIGQIIIYIGANYIILCDGKIIHFMPIFGKH